jgi:hypothetical protein
MPSLDVCGVSSSGRTQHDKPKLDAEIVDWTASRPPSGSSPSNGACATTARRRRRRGGTHRAGLDTRQAAGMTDRPFGTVKAAVSTLMPLGVVELCRARTMEAMEVGRVAAALGR